MQIGLDGLIFDRRNDFVCSEFYESTYALEKTPVAYSCGDNEVCLTGSQQNLGARSASNYNFIAETAINYFAEGRCDVSSISDPGDQDTVVSIHIADIDGSS